MTLTHPPQKTKIHRTSQTGAKKIQASHPCVLRGLYEHPDEAKIETRRQWSESDRFP